MINYIHKPFVSLYDNNFQIEEYANKHLKFINYKYGICSCEIEYYQEITGKNEVTITPREYILFWIVTNDISSSDKVWNNGVDWNLKKLSFYNRI